MRNTTPRMNKGKGEPLFGLGLAAAALGGLIIGRRLARPRRMPYLDAGQRMLAEKRGGVAAAVLAARVQARYEDLYALRPHFSQRALRFHLERNILPGLALYQTLREENDDQDAVLVEVEALFPAVLPGFRRLILLLGRLSDPFAGLRRAVHWVVRWGFPPEGWEMETVEDSERCLAFNVHRCFYLQVLTAYGAPELTAVYCGLDDLMYEALPPAITWERTRTLGRGDDRCDFRWCRKSEGARKSLSRRSGNE